MTDDLQGGSRLRPRERNVIERGMRKYDRVLVAWLTKKFGDSDLAQDLAQDTYVRVWQYAERNEIQNLKPLLFKTAANLAANEFRSRSRWRASGGTDISGGDAAALESVACDLPSPERAVVSRAEARASLDAIRQLPENQKRAFVMNRFEGKSYAEIAGVLEVSVSSIEKYIMAALIALREASNGDSGQGRVVSFPANRRSGRE